jgi:hypothetical protein
MNFRHDVDFECGLLAYNAVYLVLWVVTKRSKTMIEDPEDGDDAFLQNDDIHLQDYMASQPRRTQYTFSPP